MKIIVSITITAAVTLSSFVFVNAMVNVIEKSIRKENVGNERLAAAISLAIILFIITSMLFNIFIKLMF